MAFFGTVLAASALGGLVAGPVGAKASGFLTIQQMEANSLFRELIEEDTTLKKPCWHLKYMVLEVLILKQ